MKAYIVGVAAIIPLIAALVLVVRLKTASRRGDRLLDVVGITLLIVAAALIAFQAKWSPSVPTAYVVDDAVYLNADALRRADPAAPEHLESVAKVLLTLAKQSAGTPSFASGQAAFDAAMTELQSRRVGGVLDAVLDRPRRLVCVVTAPRRWGDLDIRRATVAAAKNGVIVDVVQIQEDQNVWADARLTIKARQRVVPANYDLRNSRQSVFEAHMRLPADVSPQSVSSIGLNCTVDRGVVPRPIQFERASLPARASGNDLVSAPFSLADFTPRQKSLKPGFHLMQCSALVGGKKLTGAFYIEAALYPVVVVAGSGGRFGLTAMTANSATVSNAARLDIAWNSATYLYGRWHEAVVPTAFWSEAELKNALEHPNPSLDPRMVVLHDLSDEEFADVCGPLAASVYVGKQILFSGVPKSVTNCALLSNLKSSQWVYDRRPQLTFIWDRSRVGTLPFAPTCSAKPIVSAEELDALRFVHLGPAVQSSIAAEICRRLNLKCGELSPSATKAVALDTFVRVTQLTREEDAFVEDHTAGAMVNASSIARRLGSVAVSKTLAPSPKRREVMRTYVIFSYGVDPKHEALKPVEELVKSGATVHLVLIDTPYRNGVLPPQRRIDPDAIAAAVRANADRSPIADDDVLLPDEVKGRVTVHRVCLTSKTACPEAPQCETGVDEVIASIAKAVAPVTDVAFGSIAVGDFGRLIDERIDDHGEADTAPLEFQKLVAKSNVQVAAVAKTRDMALLSDRPLAVGFLYGSGHVEALGYSLFEQPTNVAPEHQIFAPQLNADRWGLQRVVDLSRFVAELRDVPSDLPRLDDISVIDAPAGRVRFTLSRSFMTGGPLPSLIAVRCDRSELSDRQCQPRQNVAQPLRLAVAAPAKQSLEYELTPTDVSRLCLRNDPTRPCVVELRAVSGGRGVSIPRSKLLLVRPSRDADVLADLSTTERLKTLARYSGGSNEPQDFLAGRDVPLRLPMMLAVTLLVVSAWTWRAARRLVHSDLVTSWADAAARPVYEPPGTISAAVGQILSRPSSSVPAGAFAAYRTFEPGDRLNHAVFGDVALLAANVDVIPRVVMRFQELAVRLSVVVNVGTSMRQPAGGAKIAAAARTTSILSHLALARGAEVSVHLVGIVDAPPPLGPFWGSPGNDAIEQYVASGTNALPSSEPPALPDVDHFGSLVYISDLLHEDERFFSAAERFEWDGGKFAAVHVFDPREFSLVELGYVVGTGQLVDRSQFTPTDLRAAHARFVADLRTLLADTRAGLVVVSSADSSSSIVNAIADSRFEELLH